MGGIFGGGGGGGGGVQYRDNPAHLEQIAKLTKSCEETKRQMAAQASDSARLQNQLAQNQKTIRGIEKKMELERMANEKLKQEILELIPKARRDEDKYNRVRAFIANMAPLVFLESTALVGPKGSGKSTFLWLLGLGPKPTASFSDGTTSTMNMDKFVDTIGINIELRQVLKMLAIFLVKGVPSTLVVFSNDRVVRDALVLSYLGLRNLMFVMMSPEAVYDEEDPSRFYRQRRMDELRLQDPSIICLTHYGIQGVIPQNGNIHRAIEQLFPNMVVEMPEYTAFETDEKSKLLNTIRYQVCSLAFELTESFKGNELAFLNDVSC